MSRTYQQQAQQLRTDLQSFSRVASSVDFGGAIDPTMLRAQLDALTASLDHLPLATADRVAAEAAIESLNALLTRE